MEKLKELLEKWNHMNSNSYNFEDFTEENYEEMNKYDIKLVKYQNETDEHRWYILECNIYEINLDGQTYLFQAEEVGTLKSESMSRSDTMCNIQFSPVEAYVTTGYRIIKGD